MAFAPFILQMPRSAFDRSHAELTIALLTYQLHPMTFEALDRISRFDAGERLFPWPWDKGRPPSHMLLCREMKELYGAW